MSVQHGNLSINSENIFPIIKKWMYSDHDIFFRELVSNGCDAITKLRKLQMIGEAGESDVKPQVKVLVSSKDRTIKFIDTGLGMTADEVNEYINQIAFSGAEAFLEKYKDKTNDDQIIGHFGLGFYSAFMVAERVTIDTLSYKDDATSVHWECDGGTEYDMAEGNKEIVGTEITLFLNEDSAEFANEYRAKEVLDKYCSFMPYEIYLINEDDTEEKTQMIEKEELLETDTIIETVVEEEKESYKIKARLMPLNDTTPLWAKHPNECTEDEYKAFFRKVFRDYKEPLFWIHLNMDYPFNLKGILYFPKLNLEFESAEGVIKLYNNQVFVADNIKEVIPEFLMLLKGVIDCPDLPLNVSRSALQNDGFVKKISDYITKKVADKLSGMCKTDKENYEKYWDDISPFIKFGCLKDDKFCEKMNDYILFKNLEGNYLTLPECMEANKEHHPNTVFYVKDEVAQGQYVKMFKDEGLDAVILKHSIDQPFMNHLESKNADLKFQSIDSDISSVFKEEGQDEESLKANNDALSDIFKKALNKEKLEVRAEALKDANISSIITVSEENKRMADMMRMYGMGMEMPGMDMGETLVLNINNGLVKYILDNPQSDNVTMFCEQLYDLAKISHSPLQPEQMSRFISRSNEIMMLLAK